jgi:polyisoprenoid-binding protein YceI
MRNRNLMLVPIVFMLALLGLAAAPPQTKTLEIDPAQSRVQFTVDSTLHTVHGSFQLKPGSIQFDPAGGPASGQLVVTAASGDSDNKSRDRRMTKEILEADKYPEIIFTAQQMKGTLAPAGSSQFQLEGVMTLHGQPHPMTLKVKTEAQGNSLSADTSFDIPYIQWGLKNPSNFLLKVGDKVQIHIHAVGLLK